MTNTEILTKVIQKAIDNGWRMFGFRVDEYTPPWYVVKGGQMPTPKVVEKWVPENSLLICDFMDHYYVWEHIIFDHDFAKALWGSNALIHEDKRFRVYSLSQPIAWKYHLQQMVIAEDPIKYLGENLDD